MQAHCRTLQFAISLSLTALVAAVGTEMEGWSNPTVDERTADGVSPNASVRLCCGVDYIFSYDTMQCEPSNNTVLPVFHYSNGERVEYQFAYNVIPGFPNCTFYSLEPQERPEDAFLLLPSGELQVAGSPADANYLFSQDEYCLFSSGDGLEAVVCFREPEVEQSTFIHVIYFKVYPAGLLLSATFLTLTFIVYCMVGELRDLLGRCLMCSIVALCIAQVATSVAQMASHQLSPTTCIFIAVMMHFWFLAAFLWLNVISVNVFLTVSGKVESSSKHRNRWFVLYNVYAWGLPLLVSSVAMARDFTQGLDESPLPKPNFGLQRCWFSADNAVVVFFYGPTAVILGVNVVLFCASAWRLYKLNKKSKAKVFQFTLYLKLFILMGITWVFEVISYFAQDRKSHSPANYVWLLFDMVNILQGVAIFIVFVCRVPVLARLCEVAAGKTLSHKWFPKFYHNHDSETVNVDIKHSVI